MDSYYSGKKDHLAAVQKRAFRGAREGGRPLRKLLQWSRWKKVVVLSGEVIGESGQVRRNKREEAGRAGEGREEVGGKKWGALGRWGESREQEERSGAEQGRGGKTGRGA